MNLHIADMLAAAANLQLSKNANAFKGQGAHALGHVCHARSTSKDTTKQSQPIPHEIRQYI